MKKQTKIEKLKQSIKRLSDLRTIFKNAEPLPRGAGYMIDLGNGKALFDITDWKAPLENSWMYARLGQMNQKAVRKLAKGCGTACCVAGTAAAHPKFKDGHEKLERNHNGDYPSWFQEYFGLDYVQTDRIVMPGAYDDWSVGKPPIAAPQVVKRLTEIIADQRKLLKIALSRAEARKAKAAK